MDSPVEIIDRLPPFYRLRWRICFDRPFEAPPYLGSALRGLMGHGLRRTACVTGKKTCRGCLLLDSCIYPRLFEPASRRVGGSPRAPYVLSMEETRGRRYPEGGCFEFAMSLFTSEKKAVPYLVQAFQQGGKRGLGPKKVGFHVAGLAVLGSLGQNDWNLVFDGVEFTAPFTPTAVEPPPSPQESILEWVTPWRLKRLGQLVGPDRFHPSMLLEGLLYRYFELKNERPPREVVNRARGARIDIESALVWRDWSRYSSRQKRRMQVGGLMGRMTISGEAFEAWWPLLWLCQWLHLGKFTSMGLGRYRLTTAGLRRAEGRIQAVHTGSRRGGPGKVHEKGKEAPHAIAHGNRS